MKTDTPVFFIVNDPLRALGMEKTYPNLHIICIDYTKVVDWLLDDGVSVFCLEKELGVQNGMFRSTRELVTRKEVIEFILRNSKDQIGIVFFKPIVGIESAFEKSGLSNLRNITVLHKSATLSSKLENKLFFEKLLTENGVKHPRSMTENLLSLNHKSLISDYQNGYVVQFARGWFGNATYFIHDESDLHVLQQGGHDRVVKVSEFINSRVLTNNLVVTKDKVYQTYPFQQLTDDSGELSRFLGSTVGNLWVNESEMPFNDSGRVVSKVAELTTKIGNVLRGMGYLGFAGLDFLVDEEGEVFVQEINPRFTASAQMMTQLENEKLNNSLMNLHFSAFGFYSDQDANPDEDIFFTPFKAIRVIVRNTTGAELTVGTSLENGVYSIAEDNLSYVAGGYELSQLSTGEALVFTASRGRLLNPDQELAQIQAFELTKDEAYSQIKKIKTELTGS